VSGTVGLPRIIVGSSSWGVKVMDGFVPEMSTGGVKSPGRITKAMTAAVAITAIATIAIIAIIFVFMLIRNLFNRVV